MPPLLSKRRTVDVLVTVTSLAVDNRTQSTHCHSLERKDGEDLGDFMLRVRQLIEGALNLDEGHPR